MAPKSNKHVTVIINAQLQPCAWLMASLHGIVDKVNEMHTPLKLKPWTVTVTTRCIEIAKIKMIMFILAISPMHPRHEEALNPHRAPR